MSNMSQPNTAQIRRLLTQAFDDPSLDAFCQDYFCDVHKRFGRGMRYDEKTNLLFDHCFQRPDGFAELSQALHSEYEAGANQLEILCVQLKQLLMARSRQNEILRTGVQSQYIEPMMFSSAMKDELLIILMPFAGELNNQKIYPHRFIRDALHKWHHHFSLSKNLVRLEIWNTVVATQREARAIGEEHNATLVIWGELDDLGGIRPFTNLINKAVPMPYIQQSGNWLPLGMLFPTQVTIDALTKDLLKELPGYADYLVLFLLGIILIVGHQPNQAEKLLTQAIKTIQSAKIWSVMPYEPYYWRALAFSLQEYHLEALEDLEVALSLNPTSRLVLTQRGNESIAVGQVEAAQLDFETVLALTDTNDLVDRSLLLSNLGLALELQGKFNQALEYYQQSWQINRGRNEKIPLIFDLMRLGNLCQHQKNFKDALTFYSEALELCQQANLQQGIAETLRYIGLVHHKQEDLETALTYYQKALVIDEALENLLGQTKQLIWIGLLYLKKGEPKSAHPFFNRALQISETSQSFYGQAYALIGIGLMQKEQGEVADALKNFQDATKLLGKIGSPEVEIARLAIRDLYQT